MKITFAVACLIANTSAVKLSDPNWGPNVNALEHCPDFDERFTLADGKTRAIPYPQVYYNCKADYQLMQKQNQDPNWGPSVNGLEHCPDFDERFTLADGKTKAIPFPQVYYNCKADYQLNQKANRDPNWGPSVNGLEHCPDFDERFTLADGKTKAIPYPQVYYNCKADYQLVQKKKDAGTESQVSKEEAPAPAKDAKPAKVEPAGPGVMAVEHCPDFNERFTLADGKTKAIPYPEIHYNCNPDFQLVQKKSNDIGADIANLEHCPDFDERFTLNDGKTKAVAYPSPNYNCNADYALHQKKDIGGDIANLEHCPDFDERFTLTDGKTRAVPYPQSNYNCNPEYAITQKDTHAGELKDEHFSV